MAVQLFCFQYRQDIHVCNFNIFFVPLCDLWHVWKWYRYAILDWRHGHWDRKIVLISGIVSITAYISSKSYLNIPGGIKCASLFSQKLLKVSLINDYFLYLHSNFVWMDTRSFLPTYPTACVKQLIGMSFALALVYALFNMTGQEAIFLEIITRWNCCKSFKTLYICTFSTWGQ
jgi:hypothetical protein